MAGELESDLRDTVWTGAGSGLLISMLEKFSLFPLSNLIALWRIDVKIDQSVLEEKESFKMLGLSFSSKLDSGPYVISIAKTAAEKIGALIHSIKFLSLEVA